MCFAMASHIISSADAERFAEGLRTFELSEIGSKAWMQQHKRLEQLNLQAHASAQSDSDNYVVEALLTFEKFPVILHSLLSTEAWLDYLLPKLSERLFGAGTSAGGNGSESTSSSTSSVQLPPISVQRAYAMRIYFIIYHEATLANMLECMLYHDYAAQAFGDTIIELIDYCARKIAHLVRTGPETVSEEDALTRRLAKVRMEEHKLTSGEIDGERETKGSKAAEAQRLAALKEEAKEILSKLGGTAAAEAANKRSTAAKTPLEDIHGHLRTLRYRSSVSAVVVSRYLSEHLTSLPLSAMARFLDTHDFLVLSVPLIEVRACSSSLFFLSFFLSFFAPSLTSANLPAP